MEFDIFNIVQNNNSCKIFLFYFYNILADDNISPEYNNNNYNFILDDIWYNKDSYSEQLIADNIKRIKNGLKLSNKNTYSNQISNQSFNDLTNDTSKLYDLKEGNYSISNQIDSENSNILISQNSNSLNNNYSYYRPAQIGFYNKNNNNNNLINIQYPIQIESSASTSEETMSNNNWINIPIYMNQNYNSNMLYFGVNSSNNYSNINNNSNNNYSNINSNFVNNPMNGFMNNCLNLNMIDNHNLINEISIDYSIDFNKIITGIERRTSIKINYIPIKYKSEDLIKEIDSKLGLNIDNKNYDLFYLPMSYYNTRNFGYAFINFIDPLCIIEFYNKFQNFKWKKNNKGCQVTYAKYQGKEEFSEHILPNSGEAKNPNYFNINKSNIRIKIPKKYMYEIRKGRKDIIHYIDFV